MKFVIAQMKMSGSISENLEKSLEQMRQAGEQEDLALLGLLRPPRSPGPRWKSIGKPKNKQGFPSRKAVFS